MTNWKETITNLEWKKEIVCPYCKHRYVEIHPLGDSLFMFRCPKCNERESWLEEYNLYTTYEEGLGIYG